MSALEPSDVEVLAALFEEQQWRWMRLSIGGAELELGTEMPVPRRDGAAGREAPRAETPSRVQLSPVSVAAPVTESGLVEVAAPNLGTFYRAPAPGEAPYVKPGQGVEAGDPVGLLEVMKLYTTVEATVSGVVADICVPDGELVEAGQALILIDPNGAARPPG